MLINVRDYGVSPSAADNATAIGSAITAAVANGGDTLYFPAGTYTSSSITIPSNVNLRFIGDAASNTTIRMKAAATGNLFKQVSTSIYQKRIEFRKLTLDGNKANVTDRTSCVVSLQPDEFIMRDCIVTNAIKAGVRLAVLGVKADISQNTFKDFAGHSDAGAGEDSTGVHMIESRYATPAVAHVQGNTFSWTSNPTDRDIGAGAVAFSPASSTLKVVVTGNTFTNWGMSNATYSEHLACVHLYRNCPDSLVAWNTFTDALYAPIIVQASSGVHVIGNVITGEGDPATPNGSYGINVSGRNTVGGDMRNIIVTRNTISSMSHCNAIHIDPSSTLNGVNYAGITIDASDNVISSVRQGIVASNVTGLTANGNSISSASLKSMVLTTITTAQIRNNTASNTDTTFTSVTGLDESGNSWANH